jgi:hypothetical protein
MTYRSLRQGGVLTTQSVDQRENKLDDESEWTTVKFKQRYKNNNMQNQSYNDFQERNKQKSQNSSRFWQNDSLPKKHYWDGFDESGIEIWYIEFENGSRISNKYKDYVYLVKKYFPNDINIL